jgi:hypothetical protein
MRAQLLLALSIVACDPKAPSVDAGVDADADADAGRFDFEIVVEARCGGFPWERGEPVAGALVAVDDAVGRTELTTAQDGRALASVGPDEPFTVTVACPQHRPVVTLYELTRDEVEARVAAQGAVVVQLCRPGAEAERRRVVLSASGLPEGAWAFSGRYDRHGWPAAIEPGDDRAWSLLDGWVGGSTIEHEVELLSGDRWITALLVEPRRDAAAPAEITALGSFDLVDDRTDLIVFDFDAGLEREVIEGVTLRWPAGSLLASRGPALHPLLLAPYGPSPTLDAPAWGGALRRAETATSITVDAAYFPAAGRRLFWEINVIADGVVSERLDQPRSRRYLAGPPEPGETFDVLDIPVLDASDAPQTLRSTFAWEHVEGAERYRLDLVDPASEADDGLYHARAEQLHGQVLWSVISGHAARVTLPELPSGFSPDWWWLELARPLLHAYRNVDVEDRDPEAGPYVDYEHSFSYGEMVSLEW